MVVNDDNDPELTENFPVTAHQEPQLKNPLRKQIVRTHARKGKGFQSQ